MNIIKGSAMTILVILALIGALVIFVWVVCAITWHPRWGT
jgi:hypothetical protein